MVDLQSPSVAPSRATYAADSSGERLAHPLPLGFLALAVATFGFSALQLGWISPTEGSTIALTTLLLTTPLQLLVSVMSFIRLELPAATGMGLLSGIWASIALVTYTSPPGSTSRGLAIFLVAGAVGMAVSALAARSTPLSVLVMGGAAARFAVTAIYQWGAQQSWERVAGWVGLALAAVAVVVALVLALENSVKHRPTTR
jgi:succinate-acetate transporter protein